MRIIFFAYSKGIGLTNHFAKIAVDLYNKLQSEKNDLLIVSLSNEQSPGLWEYVEKHIPKSNIVKRDSEVELRNELLLIDWESSQYKIHLHGITHIKLINDILLKYKKNITTFLTIHSYAHGKWYKGIYSSIFLIYLLRYVDKVIFTTPISWNKFAFSKWLFMKGRIVHIPFCIKMDIKEKIKGENEKFQVIYLAQFHSHKQHLKFLPSIISFVRKYNDVVVYLCGDGLHRDEVVRIIQKEGLSDIIICPGRLPYDETMNKLLESDVALLLSKVETFGHAALEPILSEVPIISTRVGFAEYFIQDYINGIGISTNQDLLAALSYIKENKTKAERMSKIAREMALALFKYDNMINAYITLYLNESSY